MPKVIGMKASSPQMRKGITQNGKLQTVGINFQRVYYVIADNRAQEEPAILAADGIPSMYDLSLGCRCKGLTAEEVDVISFAGNLTALWEVTAEFGNDVDPSQEGGDNNEDPTHNRPKVRWYTVEEEEVLEIDAIDGLPITNDVNEPLLITVPAVYPILEIKRYELYPFDPDIILDYSNTTNLTPFWGAPRGTALMLPMETEEFTIGESDYEIVTYRIKFKMRRDSIAELAASYPLIYKGQPPAGAGIPPPSFLAAVQAGIAGGDGPSSIGPYRIAGFGDDGVPYAYLGETTTVVSPDWQVGVNPATLTLGQNPLFNPVARQRRVQGLPLPKIFKKRSWRARLLHEGTKFYVSASDLTDPAFKKLYPNAKLNDLVLSIDGSGNPVTVNLKSGGQRYRPAEAGQPEYLSFNLFPEQDFNALSLGPNFTE